MLGTCSFTERGACRDAVDGTESTNLHDETTVCDQADHALFRAVVGN